VRVDELDIEDFISDEEVNLLSDNSEPQKNPVESGIALDQADYQHYQRMMDASGREADGAMYKIERGVQLRGIRGIMAVIFGISRNSFSRWNSPETLS
jgi:hypothetical protein